MSEERSFRELVQEKVALLPTLVLSNVAKNKSPPFEKLCAYLNSNYQVLSHDSEIENEAYQVFYNFLNGTVNLKQSKQDLAALKARDRKNMSLYTRDKVFLFGSGFLSIASLVGAGVIVGLFFSLWPLAIFLGLISLISIGPAVWLFKKRQNEFDEAVNGENHLMGSFEKFLNNFNDDHQTILSWLNSNDWNVEQTVKDQNLEQNIGEDEAFQNEEEQNLQADEPSDFIAPKIEKKSEKQPLPLFYLYNPILDENKSVSFRGREIDKFVTIEECFDFLKKKGHRIENANLIELGQTLHLKDIKTEENFDIVYESCKRSKQGEVLQFEPGASCYWIGEALYNDENPLSFQAFSKAHKTWVQNSGYSTEPDHKVEIVYETHFIEEDPEEESEDEDSQKPWTAERLQTTLGYIPGITKSSSEASTKEENSKSSPSFNQVISQPSTPKEKKDESAYVKPQLEQAIKDYPGSGLLKIPIFTSNEKKLILQMLSITSSNSKICNRIKKFLYEEYEKRNKCTQKLINEVIPPSYVIFGNYMTENTEIELDGEKTSQKLVNTYPLPQDTEVALISEALKNHHQGNLYISVFSESELSLIRLFKKTCDDDICSPAITQISASACQTMANRIHAVMPSIEQLHATPNGKLIIPEAQVSEFKHLYEERLSKAQSNSDSDARQSPQNSF